MTPIFSLFFICTFQMTRVGKAVKTRSMAAESVAILLSATVALQTMRLGHKTDQDGVQPTASSKDAEPDHSIGGDAASSRGDAALVKLNDRYAQHEGVDGPEHEPERNLLPRKLYEPQECQDEGRLGDSHREHGEELPDGHQIQGLGDQGRVDIAVVAAQAEVGGVYGQDDEC